MSAVPPDEGTALELPPVTAGPGGAAGRAGAALPSGAGTGPTASPSRSAVVMSENGPTSAVARQPTGPSESLVVLEETSSLQSLHSLAPANSGTRVPGSTALMGDAAVAEASRTSADAPPGAARRRKPDPRVGSRIGKFHVLSALGRGAMGVVYLAEDSVLRRKVAVKFLLPELSAADPEIGERFLIEARAAATIQHPNVVGVFEAGQDGDSPYMVMELVTGGSVDKLIKDHPDRRLPPADATRITLQSASGLRAAHEAGVLHRDVKPANLMLTGNGLVKVADFGLAKPSGAGHSMTATGAVLGTPYYMSPEQCRGKPVDARGDVYSLGATYFRLLTGRPPFEGETGPDVMYKQCFEPLPDVRADYPAVPEECWAIIGKAMAKDLDSRYASMAALEADLAELNAGFEARGKDDSRQRPVRLSVALSRPGAFSGSVVAVSDAPAVAGRPAWAIPAAVAASLLVVGVAVMVLSGGKQGDGADGLRKDDGAGGSNAGRDLARVDPPDTGKVPSKPGGDPAGTGATGSKTGTTKPDGTTGTKAVTGTGTDPKTGTGTDPKTDVKVGPKVTPPPAPVELGLAAFKPAAGSTTLETASATVPAMDPRGVATWRIPVRAGEPLLLWCRGPVRGTLHAHGPMDGSRRMRFAGEEAGPLILAPPDPAAGEEPPGEEDAPAVVPPSALHVAARRNGEFRLEVMRLAEGPASLSVWRVAPARPPDESPRRVRFAGTLDSPLTEITELAPLSAPGRYLVIGKRTARAVPAVFVLGPPPAGRPGTPDGARILEIESALAVAGESLPAIGINSAGEAVVLVQVPAAGGAGAGAAGAMPAKVHGWRAGTGFAELGTLPLSGEAQSVADGHPAVILVERPDGTVALEARAAGVPADKAAFEAGPAAFRTALLAARSDAAPLAKAEAGQRAMRRPEEIGRFGDPECLTAAGPLAAIAVVWDRKVEPASPRDISVRIVPEGEPVTVDRGVSANGVRDVAAGPLRGPTGAPELLAVVDGTQTLSLLQFTRTDGRGRYRLALQEEAGRAKLEKVAIHPSGRLIAAAGRKGIPPAFWSVRIPAGGGSPELERLAPDVVHSPRADVTALVFDTEGRRLIAADAEGKLHVWTIESNAGP